MARAEEWVPFPGGELEGRLPTTMCGSCRGKPAAERRAVGQVLCFECYQADLERQRTIRTVRERDGGSKPRVQGQLPFEPVNRPRLDHLRAVRQVARVAASTGSGRFELRRRRAQIAARHALQQVAAGIRAHGSATPEETRAFAAAVHAAELQLPDAWLQFVVAR